jgi:hypothetical protein
LKILIAGGSGFIGRRLTRLLATGSSFPSLHQTGITAAEHNVGQREIICLTRNPSYVKKLFGDLDVRIVEGDVTKHDDLVRVMSVGIEVAYYNLASEKTLTGFSPGMEASPPPPPLKVLQPLNSTVPIKHPCSTTGSASILQKSRNLH